MNDTATVAELDENERELLREFVDIIVPSAGPHPSASEASVHLRWIDRGLNARPDLRETLLALARDCHRGDADTVIAHHAEADPETVDALLELVIACYYMSPKVRKQIGYRGQVATPILPDETEYYLRDDVLEPVSGRTPHWRQVEGAPDGSLLPTTHGGAA